MSQPLKTICFNSICLLIALTFAESTLAFKDRLKPIDIQQACEKTIHDYAIYRDNLEAENYASLFSANGSFEVPNKRYTGRDALIAYIKEQPASLITRHHITSQQLRLQDKKNLSGTIYVLAHLKQLDAENKTQSISLATAIYHDEYVMEGRECKIKQRRLSIEIMPST